MSRATSRSFMTGLRGNASCAAKPEKPPCVLISGGETTITLKGKGRGCPNTESCLRSRSRSMACPESMRLPETPTGIDGSEDNAGALIYSDTLKRVEKTGSDAKAMLADNDPWTLFNGVGDLLVTGPTLANVKDFRAVLIGTQERAAR